MGKPVFGKKYVLLICRCKFVFPGLIRQTSGCKTITTLAKGSAALQPFRPKNNHLTSQMQQYLASFAACYQHPLALRYILVAWRKPMACLSQAHAADHACLPPAMNPLSLYWTGCLAVRQVGHSISLYSICHCCHSSFYSSDAHPEQSSVHLVFHSHTGKISTSLPSL